MESSLQHPELVDAFVKRYAPGVLLRVHVKLDEAKTSGPAQAGRAGSAGTNHFDWSSPSGRRQPLKTGTMCQAAIVVEKRRLISLVLPWAKHLVGGRTERRRSSPHSVSTSKRFRLRGAKSVADRGERHETVLDVRGRSFDVGDEEGCAGSAGEVAHERDVKSIATP